MYIATLDAGAKLNMEMTLDKGRGYVSAEQNRPAQNVIGVIPVDSIYTPVLKANFKVDNTRVGNVTDKGKLTMEIWTDGSIRANEAISMSAKVLIEHFELFLDLTEGVSETESIMARKERQREGKGSRFNDRRAGFICTQLQLPEARRYKYGRGSYQQVRGGDDEGEKPRPQVA